MNQPLPVLNLKRILPVLGIPKDKVQTYWQQLYMDGGLDKRLCTVKEPDWSDVKDMIALKGDQMYCICQGSDIVGEFMLDNFQGRSAQVHFSMHPKCTLKQTLSFGQWAANEVLGWTVKGEESPMLRSLFGLTPITNRAACIWTLKVGFKKLGILPGGIVDRGRVVDAMVSVYG